MGVPPAHVMVGEGLPVAVPGGSESGTLVVPGGKRRGRAWRIVRFAVVLPAHAGERAAQVRMAGSGPAGQRVVFPPRTPAVRITAARSRRSALPAASCRRIRSMPSASAWTSGSSSRSRASRSGVSCAAPQACSSAAQSVPSIMERGSGSGRPRPDRVSGSRHVSSQGRRLPCHRRGGGGGVTGRVDRPACPVARYTAATTGPPAALACCMAVSLRTKSTAKTAATMSRTSPARIVVAASRTASVVSARP